MKYIIIIITVLLVVGSFASILAIPIYTGTKINILQPASPISTEQLYLKSWEITTYNMVIEFEDASGKQLETVTIERVNGRLVITTTY
jgi:hypothetical protein